MLFNGLNLLAAAMQQQQPKGDLLGGILPLIVIIVIFYFLLFAPMRKQRKQLQQTISSLKNGDKVVTQGGIHGVIAGVSDDKFQLKIANNVKIDISKNAIAGKVSETVSK